MSTRTEENSAIALACAMGVVFSVLKLTDHITWSWLWVTAPLWGMYAIVGVVLMIAIPISLITDRVSVRRARRHNAEIIARSQKR
jgi:hypothetical protein